MCYSLISNVNHYALDLYILYFVEFVENTSIA
jgi:hypothetical protein